MSSDVHPALRALGVAVDAPAGIRRVRAVVRDLAVRGNLTDHLAADGTASDLLAAINRDNGAATAPAADAPYSLPKNWEWATFEQVASIESNLVNPADFRARPHIAPDNIEKGTGRLLAYRTIGEDGVTSGKHRFFAGQ